MTRIFAFLIFAMLTMTCMGSTGVPAAVPKQVLKYDSGKVSVRKFNAAQLKNYSKERAFIYQDNLPDNESWWSRLWTGFWHWFWKGLQSTFKQKYSGTILQYIVIGLFVGIVIFAIFKIIGLDFKLFSGKSAPVAVPYSESAENIHEINFNDELSKAILAGNYRLAVRLCYLSTLKRLSDKNMISWQPEKTNHAYIMEIGDPEKRKSFQMLTQQFEYIWYGEFSIDQHRFNLVKKNFDVFNGREL